MRGQEKEKEDRGVQPKGKTKERVGLGATEFEGLFEGQVEESITELVNLRWGSVQREMNIWASLGTIFRK